MAACSSAEAGAGGGKARLPLPVPVGPVADVLPRSAALVGAPIVGPEVAAVRIAVVPCVRIRRRIVRLRATEVVVGKRVPECPDALRVVDLEALGDVVREPVVGD